MEISFRNTLLKDLYEGNKVKNKEFNSNPSLIKQFIKAITKLKAVSHIEQLYQFAGLNYERLKGNRKGLSSVRINDQYRIIFEEIPDENEPFEIILLEIEELSKHYE